MKRKGEKLVVYLIVALILFCIAPLTSNAAIPGSIQYQGILKNSTGQLLDGSPQVTFAIYDQSGGGVALWSDTSTVTVIQGVYSVTLGSPGNPFPQSLFQTPLWLSIAVESDLEMSPRQPLTSVPFAFTARDTDTVQGVDAAAKLVELEARIVELESHFLCGNGVIDTDEDCDDGLNNGTTLCGCASDCTYTPASVQCVPPQGACDDGAFCDGGGSCSSINYRPDGTVCDDANPSTYNDQCGGGVCNGTPYSCTPSAACVTSEPDGLGGCNETIMAGNCLIDGQCYGDGTVNPVNSCETCSIGQSPLSWSDVTNGAPCGGAPGQCEEADSCQGGVCLDGGFSPSGSSCGSSSYDACTQPDTCDGAGNCQPNHESNSIVCRASAGVCDVDEFCDGIGTCPSDSFQSVGYECRSANGECDVAEYCDGSNASCPADDWEPDSTPCSSDGGTQCLSGQCL